MRVTKIIVRYFCWCCCCCCVAFSDSINHIFVKRFDSHLFSVFFFIQRAFYQKENLQYFFVYILSQMPWQMNSIKQANKKKLTFFVLWFLFLCCQSKISILSFNKINLSRNLKSNQILIITLKHFFFLKILVTYPADRDQDSHFVGVVIALLTTIILLLVAAIMYIVARNKRSPHRSDVLNSLQHNFNQDSLGLGIDKHGNRHMKVNFRIFFFVFV